MLFPLRDLYQVRMPDPGVVRPILIDVPHAGTEIPAEVRAQFVASDAKVAEDLARSTDHAVDRLWDAAIDRGAVMAVTRLSRLACDVERFVNPVMEPCEAFGRGAIYTKAFDGEPLRSPAMTIEDFNTLTASYYEPWQTMIGEAVYYLLVESGFRHCTIIDAHSFPAEPLPCELDPGPDARPDICLGWDEDHTPESFRRPLVDFFESHGFSVLENRPFAGCYVPSRYYKKDRQVRSLMIEVNRDLYWDEVRGDLHPIGGERMKDVLLEAFVLVDELTRKAVSV